MPTAKGNKYELKSVNLDDIYLDTDNPRFRAYLLWSNTKIPKEAIPNSKDEETIMSIYNDPRNKYFYEGIDKHKPSIKETGVEEPIYVVQHPKKINKYIVKEGNLRCVILKSLQRSIRNGEQKQTNIDYSSVQAFIIPKATTDAEIQLKILQLQTGRHKWGALAEALHYKRLVSEHQITIKEIERRFGTKKNKIDMKINSYNLWEAYVTWHKKKYNGKVPRESQYSRFEEAHKQKSINENMLETKTGREKYFHLITGEGGTTTGRLGDPKAIRAFGKNVADDPALIDDFYKNKSETIDSIVKKAQRKNPSKAFPNLLKDTDNLVKDLFPITQEKTLIKNLSKNPEIIRSLKQLKKQTTKILDNI
tara:strand:- start:4250 stop:5341 length:1092 start_codon:yes stop_codon:yes gene_type:complete